MTNIWDFLLFSLNLTLTAGLILIMKRIFKDLLSARWQYGIWSVLLLRMLIPMTSQRNFLLPVSQYIESLRFSVEETMSSVYTDFYNIIKVNFPLAIIKDKPESLTDILFLVYAAGVVLFALVYIISYLRLRLIVRKGKRVSDETEKLIDDVCEKYSLKRCKALCIDTTSSAFICGFVKPVLVLPENKQTDEKIILHELLHLKNKDTLQNALWCALRCINWCNPIMQYVFSVINNDIEAYCDLRVMESLHGEERRDYGRVLLAMVNTAYQKVPGTSSVSNGGKNISRRIDSIVKFKKYPKGMALVSVCITVVMSLFCVYGSAVSYVNNYEPVTKGDFYHAVALAKSQKCETLPSAVDAYAKALRNKNGIMLLHAMPEERHSEIIDNMLSEKEKGRDYYYYESGEEFKYCDPVSLHLVYNYTKMSDKKYYCDLIIALSCEDKSELEEMYKDAVFKEIKDLNENIIYEYKGYLVIPLYVEHDGKGWIVTGEGERYICDDIEFDISLRNRTYTLKSKTGEITYSYHTSFRHNSDDVLDFQLKPYLKVTSTREECLCLYKANDETIKNAIGKSFTMISKDYYTVEEYEAEYQDMVSTVHNKDFGALDGEEYIDITGSDTTGAAWYNISEIEPDWNGVEKMGGGGGFGGNGIDIDDYQVPEVIAVWIKSGDEIIDKFIIFTDEGGIQQ